MISSLLGRGRHNARTADEIATLAGGKDCRSVTREIERERRGHVPICAGADGYYLAGDAGELRRYISCLRRRTAQIQRTLCAMEATLDEMEGQVSLWQE